MREARHQTKTTRCAVYTRKSSEEGLEQSFNSLHAQREACESYICSQKHEGWTIVPAAYDDGGFSGGTMERPALQALLADIRNGKVDVVVVYKIDRLTRSLFDFAKIVEIFDAASVSFVSVTQSFNTTTSMGRLTLNVLLSFAQFEREVTGERIRDKIAASRRKGMWMGGNIPLGYDLREHRLVINETEAATVRTIFEAYARLGTVRKVKAELNRLGLKTKLRASRRTDQDGTGAKGGLPFGIGHLYTILRNPIYVGQVRHKDQVHLGAHEAIISVELWEEVQAKLAANAVERMRGTGVKSPSLLTGKIFDQQGRRLTPSHAVKGAKRYRYYCTTGAAEEGGRALRLPALDIENVVIEAVQSWLADPNEVLQWLQSGDYSSAAIGTVLEGARKLGEELGRNGEEAGPHSILQPLLHRVDLTDAMVQIMMDADALAAALQLEPGPAEFERTPIVIERSINLHNPGKGQRLILTSAAAEARPDAALIGAIVRARRWFRMLKDRQVDSIAELGRGEGANRGWISNQISLAFLSPAIVQSILDGTQPPSLTLERLVEIAAATSDWNQQRDSMLAA